MEKWELPTISMLGSLECDCEFNHEQQQNKLCWNLQSLKKEGHKRRKNKRYIGEKYT